jgi:hypothetical protein
VLLDFALPKTNERKVRLFTCACGRSIWHLLPDEGWRRAIEVAEQVAEGSVTVARLNSLRRVVPQLNAVPRGADESFWAGRRAAQAVSSALFVEPVGEEIGSALEDARFALALVAPAEMWSSTLDAVRKAQATLVRDIFGNPFRSSATPEALSSTVAQLARAQYQGEQCAFALHDALLEGGHTELAEHFREPIHPKGCWALDLILGKN